MDLFGFGIVFVHFLIISHSYYLICKGQIKAKELYVFWYLYITSRSST